MIKRTLIVFFGLLLFCGANAKYLKFAVDMTGIVVSNNGMHVAGDFQTAAGYSGGNWNAATTAMSQVGTTGIYAVIVNVPAFRKYEYKFVNGDLFYETEFVPEESRVGYNFNDNRWIYVDSISTDTMFVGAIGFSANAPAGLKLLRVKVNMKEQTSISTNGVHVAGDFQGWDTQKNILYSFGNKVYEMIVYTDSNTSYQYKYYNGNATASSETVPAACRVNNNRNIMMNKDTVLTAVCFSSCDPCSTVGIRENNETSANVLISPNPSSGNFMIHLGGITASEVVIYDIKGIEVKSYTGPVTGDLAVSREALFAGIYFIRVLDTRGTCNNSKLVLE
jgi:hypothetical protein